MIDPKYQVFENILPKESFDDIKEMMLGNNFPHYFSSSTDGNDQIPMFCHIFVDNTQINSDWFELLNSKIKNIYEVVKDKAKANVIVRIKSNLYPQTKDQIFMGKHTDFPNNEQDYLTGVLNLSNCDGFTALDVDGEEIRIKSKENQLILFDGKILHYGSTATDNNRLIINFDFLRNE